MFPYVIYTSKCAPGKVALGFCAVCSPLPGVEKQDDAEQLWSRPPRAGTCRRLAMLSCPLVDAQGAWPWLGMSCVALGGLLLLGAWGSPFLAVLLITVNRFRLEDVHPTPGAALFAYAGFTSLTCLEV